MSSIAPEGRLKQTDYKFRAGLLIVLVTVFLVAVWVRAPLVNGYIWEWNWREPQAYQIYGYCLVILPVLLWTVRQILGEIEPSTGQILFLLFLTCFGFQFLSLYGEKHSFERIASIINSRYTTGYFTDAKYIQNWREWLENFHKIKLQYHSSTHPAGPIFSYYVLIKIFGVEQAKYIGGILLGLLSSSGVFVVYFFAGIWKIGQRIKLLCAAHYSVLPAIILFFPGYDQVYPVLCMLLVVLWVAALNGKPYFSVLFGLLLSFCLFYAYNLLVMGAFLGLYTIFNVINQQDRLIAVRNVIARAVLVLLVVVLFYSGLFLATGYDPIAAFNRALSWQAHYEDRPYWPGTIVNIYDFCLGGGIIVFALFLMHCRRVVPRIQENHEHRILALSVLLSLLVINFSNLLDYETARVWLFLQPLVLVPAAMEFSRFPRQVIYLLFSLQWLVVVTLKANMKFLGGG